MLYNLKYSEVKDITDKWIFSVLVFDPEHSTLPLIHSTLPGGAKGGF